jgi:hypothetical protein
MASKSALSQTNPIVEITLRFTAYPLLTGYPVVTNTSVDPVLEHFYATPLHYTISQFKLVLGRDLQLDTECVVLKRRRLTPGEWSNVLDNDQTVEDLIMEGSLWPGSEMLMSLDTSY